MSDETNGKKLDFNWVKNKVTQSLDEETLLLWSSLLKWLEEDGENAVRKQLEVSAEVLKNDAFSKISALKSKIPFEE